MTKSCNKCALLTRLKSCNGTKHPEKCPNFIDYRAGCRRCAYARSCQTLGKKTGILHICSNFEKAEGNLLPLSAFPDYERYKELHPEATEVKVQTKSTIKKISVKKSDKRDKHIAHDEDVVKSAAKPNTNSADLLLASMEASTKEDSWSPEDIIQSVIKSNYDPRAFDLIDEGDIVKPDNPVRFILEPHFMNINLFPKQLQMAIEYFSGACPHCSDLKFIHNIEVNTPIEEMLDRVTLYSNGVCPKCGGSRYEAIEKGEIGNYSTFVGLCGQRCLTGDTLVVTESGLKRIRDCKKQQVAVPELATGNTHPQDISNFYHYTDCTVIDIYADGYNYKISGTPEHKLLTPNGYKKIEDLQVGDTLYATIGTKKFGNSVEYRYGLDENNRLTDNLLSLCNPYQVMCALSLLDRDDNANIYFLTTDNEGLIYDLVSVFTNADIDYTVSVQESFFTITVSQDIDWDKLEKNYNPYIKEIIISKIVVRNEKEETFDLTVPEYHRFIASSIISHNSGKSIFHGIVACAVLAQYLSLPNPISFMKQLESVTFTMTFVGLRYQDAFDNLWNPIYKNITSSPWFKTYHQFLDEQGARLGMELYKLRDSFVIYNHKGLGITPAGPDKRKLRGKCIYKNAYISTSQGIFKIKDITLNDNLCVYSRGKSSSVIGCIKQEEKKKCLKIILKSGQKVICSTDHRIPVFSKEKQKLILREANELRVDDYLVVQLGGEFPKDRSDKKIENIYDILRASYYETLNYVQKLFSCKDNNLSGINYYHVNEDFILLLQLIIQRLGYFSTIENNKNYYTLSIKQHIKDIGSDNIFIPISSITNVGYQTVYDLEIDSKDHLFPAGGILVHNTRIWSSMDEVGHFTGRDGNMMLDPDEVAIALDNSLTTVRVASNKLLPRYPDVPTAHAFYISSPRTKLDKIMRLYKQSKVIPSYYGIKGATWEINPSITRNDLNDNFIADPVGAERDFGANPPFGANPYFSNPADVVGIVSKRKNAIIIDKFNTIKDSLGGSAMYPTLRFIRRHSYPSVLAVDAGFNNNSFALALMNRVVNEEGEPTGSRCSALIEIMPKGGIPLNFPKIYEYVITPILKTYNVKLVGFDRWQSINLRQQVYQDFEIDAAQYSVDMADFQLLKEHIIDESFKVPELEQPISEIITLEKDLDTLITGKPISHFLIQLLTSKDNGRIIDKGDETSDDLLRAVCLGHALLYSEEFMEYFEGLGAEESLYYPAGTYLGSIASKGSSGSGSSSGQGAMDGRMSIPGIGIYIRR